MQEGLWESLPPSVLAALEDCTGLLPDLHQLHSGERSPGEKFALRELWMSQNYCSCAS